MTVNVSTIPKDQIVGFDCRFATYVKSTEDFDDALIAKQYTVLKDGTRIPSVKVFENYPVDFYVTKKGYQNHQEKKEAELVSRLDKYTTTQRKKPYAIAAALGKPGLKSSVRMLARSPYLYGSDIHPASLLKKRFRDKWPEAIGPIATVAVGDIETDVHGNGDIILISLTMGNRAFTAVSRQWIQGVADPEKQARAAFDKYLGDVKLSRNIDWELKICETPGECVEAWAQRAHAWKPDFISFWNINYDMPRMILALQKEGIDPADVFSDPDIPKKYRYFNYREGKAQKVTQDGTVIPLHPAERWHIVETPASFYFIDSMCLYCRIRIAAGKEPSYGLDAIMNKHVKRGKLSFTATDHIDNKLEWHQVMQRDFKIEYIIYNVFDCIGTEMIDEKVKDIRSTFATLIGISDFGNFNSNPRKLVDDLHFVYEKKGMVIATTSDAMRIDLDNAVIGLNGHVTTLNTELMDYQAGVRVFADAPHIETKVFFHAADLDVAATYPREQIVFNISKATTWLELLAIQGLNEEIRREVGINISGGVANAWEISTEIHNFPTPAELLALYKKEKMPVAMAA